MNRNNKDLYQILKIEKNASQQEINSVVLKTNPKDNPEVGKALMVLTDPQKRIEYDQNGWKDEWERDWEKERNFRHAIFEEIQNYKHHYGNTYALKPDGFRVYVWADEHLDPNLFAPSSGFVNKIWDIRGSNWKQELENFKNKVLAALDEAWEKGKKTPLLGDCWEGVENGNCAKCGKSARLRRKGKHSDGKSYCSPECYYENAYKTPKYEFQKAKFEIPEKERELLKLAKNICGGCRYEGYDCYKTEEGKYHCKSCFNKYLEELKNPDKYRKDEYPSPDKHRTPESPLSDRIKQLEKDIKHYKEKKKSVPEKEKPEVQKLIDDLEKELKQEKLKIFLKERRGETSITEVNRFTGKTTVIKKTINPLLELLKWMKKEGITNISLNSQGKLVAEYGNLNKIVEDNNLSDEQKEIKEFFQQSGQTYLNQGELEEIVNKEKKQENKDKDKNKWIMPAVIIGMGAVILILIGVIIHKNKKRVY